MKTNQLQAGDKITEAVRLVRPLAEGGMGRVWIAEHLGLHAEVVVKLMAPEMAARSDGAERFAREAAIAAAIKSPHVVQVFDHGVTASTADEGTPYIVMELLEGKDLGDHLAAHGRMDPKDVVALVVQIGKALSKAHKAGIVHRDIKPDNIFLCETEGGEIFVKLLDFGTARRDTQASSRTTVPGQIMGTPYYMSPEQ
ncbi:MAG TPA: serine/threonine-protein kinase, partial [Labilithrix sp.]|nr:serine/threonine-protein kinase [Labilithrix sp.]